MGFYLNKQYFITKIYHTIIVISFGKEQSINNMDMKKLTWLITLTSISLWAAFGLCCGAISGSSWIYYGGIYSEGLFNRILPGVVGSEVSIERTLWQNAVIAFM